MCRKYDRTCQLWWFNDEYPNHLAFLDSYWIDLFEVTNAKYQEFVRATGHRPALDETCQSDKCREGNLWKETSFPPQISQQPVTQVSWHDANAYCHWRGKRLPSEAEWEKAARGEDSRKFPWGNEPDPTRANVLGLKDKYRYTSSTGNYLKGKSPYGVMDMAGNVWGWSTARDQPY